MVISDRLVLISLLGSPPFIEVDVPVEQVTQTDQSNRTVIYKDAVLELQLLRLRWGWIANYYGPHFQHDNECCTSEVMEWYKDAVDFQLMWGKYNTPHDVAVAISKIEAEFIAGDESSGAP